MPDRFEPIPRDDGVDNGLAARVHDPLWMLCRQWQFGEFRGEDAGSISMVNVDVDTRQLDGWRPGVDTDWRPYDPAATPLERLVEEEPVNRGLDPRLRAQGGIRLARQLAAAGIDSAPWVGLYAFIESATERTSRGLTALIRGRIADGARVANGLRALLDPTAADDEAAALLVPDSRRAAVAAIAADWLQWWTSRAPGGEFVSDVGRRPAAWDDTRLEHAFATRAAGLTDIELRATEYDGGMLDWWSMDAGAPVGPPGAAADPGSLHLSGIPGPATFGGMPASRFWEMEDAKIDLASVDAAPQDLGRLLMVSYATVYGNDWYVVPIRLPIGTLCRVKSFTVTNVFGGIETVGPAAAESPDFNLFGLTDVREASGASPWFLLASVLPGSLESAPVERVFIARDEMANLVWAVEQRIEDNAGFPYERYDAMSRPVPADPSAMPAYHVDNFVPDYCYPLVPEHISPGAEAVRFRLVPLARRAAEVPADDGDAPVHVPLELPLGVILAAARGSDPFWLHEEEVPRSGIDVGRSHQRARWHDGSTHSWTTRRKGSGTGESSSGLRFDAVTGI
jgi:hypothetical protein